MKWRVVGKRCQNIIGAPTGAAAGKGATAAGLNSIPTVSSAVNGFLTDPNRGTGTTPKAYINYILFDEQFNYVGGNFSRVGTANTVKSHYGDAQMQNIPVVKNGYIYIYVSNESPVNVYFDNLQVTHTHSPILEETHYYPFGLTMAGISSKAAGKLETKMKFQGQEFSNKEFSDGSGLDIYEFKYRSHDPQIGRFLQIDPLSEKYVHNSTYAFSENKVTNHIELEGLESVPVPLVLASRNTHHSTKPNTLTLNKSSLNPTYSESYSEKNILPVNSLVDKIAGTEINSVNFTERVSETITISSARIGSIEGVGEAVIFTSFTSKTDVKLSIEDIKEIVVKNTTEVSYTKIISRDEKSGEFVISLNPADSKIISSKTTSPKVDISDRTSETLLKLSPKLEDKTLEAIKENKVKLENANESIKKAPQNF